MLVRPLPHSTDKRVVSENLAVKTFRKGARHDVARIVCVQLISLEHHGSAKFWRNQWTVPGYPHDYVSFKQLCSTVIAPQNIIFRPWAVVELAVVGGLIRQLVIALCQRDCADNLINPSDPPAPCQDFANHRVPIQGQ